jgi:predicted Na+-dependent transporter
MAVSYLPPLPLERDGEVRITIANRVSADTLALALALALAA